jgi:hypothetical protein
VSSRRRQEGANEHLAFEPMVTWLLPVRNGMPYLPETLESIEAQTYRAWQVLAWDNGSSDGTVEELNRWIPARIPGRVVSDRPLRLAESRARLVAEASTELCAWIDAEDVNLADRLESQVRFLLAHPGVALVGGQLIAIDEEGHIIGPYGRFPLGNAEIVLDMLTGPGTPQGASLFRRSAILDAGNYRQNGHTDIAEDYDLWLRLAQRHQLANLSQPVLKYRMHSGSTTAGAQRAGLLRPATRARFAEHASGLYGCSAADALRLSTNSHPFALPALFRIARHLRMRLGIPVTQTLQSPRFLRGAREMLAPWDAGTAAILWILRRQARRRVTRPTADAEPANRGVVSVQRPD